MIGCFHVTFFKMKSSSPCSRKMNEICDQPLVLRDGALDIMANRDGSSSEVFAIHGHYPPSKALICPVTAGSISSRHSGARTAGGLEREDYYGFCSGRPSGAGWGSSRLI